MWLNGVVEINKSSEFDVSMSGVFKMILFMPHLHDGTNDALRFAIGLKFGDASELLTDIVFDAGLYKRM